MINFYAINPKGVLGKILRFPLRFIPPDLTVYILQGKLRGKKWIFGAGVHSYWLGCYEYKTQIMFSNLVNQGAVVYDVGANVGFYTLLASVLVGPGGRVFAFEPLPRNINYLKKHLQINKSENVMIIEAAVSDTDGFALFEGCIDNASGHLSAKGALEVKVVSLDNLVLKDGFPPPEYIKIDAEGKEFSVLSGAKRIIADYSPVIFFSNPGDADLHRQSCAFLKSFGYDLHSVWGEDINGASEILALKKK